MYTLFICDQHKSRDSLRFIGLSTDIYKVRNAVKDLLINKVVGDENDDIELDDINSMDMNDLNNNITYFHLEDVPINVLITDGGYYA